jgi:hypothetical protein
MNGTKTDKTARTRQTNSTASVTGTTVSASPCGCGCHGQALPSEGCCTLTCFERPQYFCGQLLSDADLTAEETYFREKNKLYHRTIDGFGVVCGLRMTCDGQCKGHITIGDGYAIDCCGNDLIVCQPRSFDVIGELRKKKWLVEMPRERDLSRFRQFNSESDENYDSGNDNRDCISKTCYYIGICYEEEALDFVTPYSTDCTPAPAPCQATRIREGVRFEIYDKLPVRPNPLDKIEQRIECCFRLFREGQFSRALQQLAPRILNVLCNKEIKPDPGANSQANQDGVKSPRENYEAQSLFEELRVQFLHELRTCPDQYTCNLEEQVYRLRQPARDDRDVGTPALEAFTRLLELIQKYVFGCVLAQFAFECPEPPDPCCVLIGSVEVVNGRLTRVINYPRWYLWCFANFFEVLVYTLANEAACSQEQDNTKNQDTSKQTDDRKPRNGGCCPDFEVDVCDFLNLFVADNQAGEYAARSSVQAMKDIHRALVTGFDFTKPNGIAPSVLNRLSFEKAENLAKELNFSLESLGEPPSEPQDPVSALLANLIHRGTSPIAAFQREGHVIGATRIINASASPISKPDTVSPGGAAPQEKRIKQLEDELQKLREALAKPPEKVAQVVEDRFTKVEEALRGLKEAPAKPAHEVAEAMEERMKKMEEGLRSVEKGITERVEHLWRKIFKDD